MTDTEHRLEVVEAKEAVRDCLARYLDLCDVPGPLQSPDQLGVLFTADATWEGLGPEYAGKFGIARGRSEIVALVSRYLPPADHFLRNVHLVGSEQIRLHGNRASGQWIMQQLSLYATGTAEILCARLTIDFDLDRTGGRTAARMSRFCTRRMFAAPLPAEAMAQRI